MDEKIVLFPIPLSELKSVLSELIDEKLALAFEGNVSQKESMYLTREDVSTLLKVSLPTLNTYTKNGIIKGYKFGDSVRYKSYEIDLALKEIGVYKSNRRQKLN